MTRKSDRISSQIVRELSQIIFEEAKDSNLKKLTITAAEAAPDLGIAKIYYTYLSDENREDVQKEVEKASSFFRTKLAERLDIRHTPELKFIFDESIEYGQRIENIIKNIHQGD